MINMGLSVSKNGIELIKEFEGLELNAYLCPTNHPTVGYGHLLTQEDCVSLWGVDLETVKSGIKSGKMYPISESKAEQLLTRKLLEFSESVRILLSVKTSQNQFDAMVSLAYNIGIGASPKAVEKGVSKSGFRWSTLLSLHNQGRFSEAALEFEKYSKGRVKGQLVQIKGLLRRRLVERNLYRKA